MFSLTARTIAFCFILPLFISSYKKLAPTNNDDCANATSLTIGVTETGGTVKGMNASSGVPVPCSGNPDDDVWYTFTLTSTNTVTITLSNIQTNLNSSGAMVQLLSGSCTSLTAVSGACGNTEITKTGLASGTYYIRVFSAGAGNITSNAGFNITVNIPPVNDDCNNSTQLTYNVAKASQTLSYASDSGVPVGTCTGNPDDDVWYKFVATSTSAIVSLTNIGTSLSSSGAIVQVFSGTCGSLTSIACGASSVTATGLITSPSTTYYVRVYSSGSGNLSSNASFDITVSSPPPPPTNDGCSGATSLTIGSGSSGTVWAATDSGIPAVCSGTPDDDVWYKFTPTATSATITLSGVGTDLTASGANIEIFSGSCGSLAPIACGSSGMTVLALTAGNTYYARVYSSGSGSIGSTAAGSAFTITVKGPAAVSQSTVGSGRMNEVFQQTTLSGAGVLQYPWEITYGPDNNLWITESRGYKVYRMDPNTGAKTTVLDLNSNSTDLTAWGADSLRAVNLTSQSNWNSSANNWPQGGLAGLAIHPKFGDASGLYNFVYISYVHRYLSTASGSAGIFFRNKIVRFRYNSVTGKLGSPAVVCDTIPGGQDHNSQRMIIAPVTKGGTSYLFYAAGDMGAGQFANRLRPENAQHPESYEGKILRFNLEADSDGDSTVPNAWIPNDNPYNTLLGKQSAVYSIGIRNNQGFAYDTSKNVLYGSSHGPYSDDEINVIEGFRNYGHPLIEGFVDGNYNGDPAQGTSTSVSAGAPYTDNLGVSTCPPIGDEAANKAAIDASGYGLYKDPLFSAYAAPQATVASIWKNNPGNALPAPGWPTEAWSGLDLYSNKLIPGWKRSLVAASLKWGRLLRLRMNAAGDGTAPTNTVSDTVSYFGSTNRFRDLAFSPNGKDIFVIMDNSSTTSGPGSANPVVPGCQGCVQKYTFLGYNSDANGKSMIPTSIDVTAGTANSCQAGTTITIDNSNNNLWVPITGEDGNIMVEIKANGNNLGTVTSSFYTNSGPVRENNLKRLYLDRNMTITPQVQPSSPVSIRLYLTANELTALENASNSKGSSGVTSISNVSIYKNSDACGGTWGNTTTPAVITPVYAEAFGSNGFVLQADISSFSSFYFANTNTIVLPLQLLSFKGSLQNRATLLQWETTNEINTSYFIVERSSDGRSFSNIGKVDATGSNHAAQNYSYTDNDALFQASSILYYRLKMVDKDGKFSYSKVISVMIEPAAYTVSIYPNPMQDILKIKLSLSKAENLHIQITDMNGRVVYKRSKFAGIGSSELQIDTKGWASQLYSVKVVDSKGNVMATENVIKQ